MPDVKVTQQVLATVKVGVQGPPGPQGPKGDPGDSSGTAGVIPVRTESEVAALLAANPGAVVLSASVVADPADAVAPEVTAFTVGTPTLLTVPITAFTATDAVGVAGYLITESATPPLAGDAGWSGTAPTEYTAASAGATTLYAWAKDIYNVSTSLSQAVNFPGDVTNPTISVFDIPATASSLTVNISTWTESDDVGVVGWFLSENASHAAFTNPDDAGWLGAEPTDFTFAGEGARTLYAAVKDAAGNISTQTSDACTITLPVDAAPTVTAFTLPASSDLTVDVTTFTASDDSAVVGYLITESATPPLAGDAGWTGSAPTTVTASGEGSITFHPWAKDDIGQVSAVYGSPQTVTVTNQVPAFSAQPTESAVGMAYIDLAYGWTDTEGDSALVEYTTDNGATWATLQASEAPGAGKTGQITALSSDGVTALSANTAYTWGLRLTALTGNATPVTSNTVNSTTVALAAPTNMAVDSTSGGNAITVSFTDGGADSVRVYYSTTSPVTTGDSYVGDATTPQNITGLTAGQRYYFAATSVAGGSESGLSAEVEGCTNELLQTEAISTTPWVLSNASANTNVVVAPDSATTADTLIDAVTEGGVGRTGQEFSLGAGDETRQRCYSVYVKDAGSSPTMIEGYYYTGGTLVSVRSIITWSGGVPTPDVGNVDGIGDGWYRFYHNITNNDTGNTAFLLRLYATDNDTADTGSATYWGAQVIHGAVPGAYTPRGAS